MEEKLARGEETAQSMLEQWLTEKKLTKEEAVVASATMLTAGVHTVYNTFYYASRRSRTRDTVKLTVCVCVCVCVCLCEL